ncbi:glycosyltransferase family 2 protein [Thomasclavelia cocleata]|uniref:glycosyltransferase family 2 protein n=1 Tax=Thomasclavelia cocleata TaxID=69824 RepID=UPI002557F86E|nr:glycosyltransferase family 2 protein [Thomasclavelia cocleata]
MSEVLFSIIIPLYNKAEWIEKTIECVLSQVEKNYEIIIIDDGSSDGSDKIVKNITDDRIRFIRQKNQGVSVARNNGIMAANGKYVSFLDADDLWESDYLSVTRELFKKYPKAKIACPSYKVRYNKKEVIPTWRNVSTTEDCILSNFLETAKSKFWIVNSSCITIERKVLLEMEKIFPVGETVYEDFDLWIRLGVRYPIAHSNKVCSTYNRMTDTNARVTHTNKVVYSKTFMCTLNELLSSKELSNEQKLLIREIKDRRMVPYIFSLLLTRQRKIAKQEIKYWIPVKVYKKYKYGLRIAVYMPYFFINWVQKIRYHVF